MNVRVTKFDRLIDTAKVCVGFYVAHPSVDTGLYVDATVDMSGTDANMVETAWIELLPRVTQWVKDEQAKAKATVGSAFTVPVVFVTVPTESPTGPTGSS
jgi:hypothetical protein